MKRGDVLFITGIVVMGLGTVALDSRGTGGVIAATAVLIGTAVAAAGYLIRILNEERRETNRRCEDIRHRKAG